MGKHSLPFIFFFSYELESLLRDAQRNSGLILAEQAVVQSWTATAGLVKAGEKELSRGAIVDLKEPSWLQPNRTALATPERCFVGFCIAPTFRNSK